ncbi:MAG TPA: hypothetical protein VFR41_05245 [Acidimicrobiia bacterium]|nr:hypothetical protein [Acidimicrobiia bacterium]
MKHLSAALAMCVVLLVAAPAVAARQSAYAPTLTTSLQNGATVLNATETPYVVSGCGYNDAYGGVTVVVQSPVAVAFAGQMPTNGCISLSNFATQGPGTYTLKAYQHIRNRDVVVATDSFVL